MSSSSAATPPASAVQDAPEQGPGAYPALLRDLADTVTRQLTEVGIDAGHAQQIGTSVAEHVREHYGGQLVYMPMGASYETRRRWLEIWQAFNGTNHGDLARRFGMNVKQIYRVLAVVGAEMRKRAQPGLPFEEEA